MEKGCMGLYTLDNTIRTSGIFQDHYIISDLLGIQTLLHDRVSKTQLEDFMFITL